MRQQAFCSSQTERAASANALVKIYFKLYIEGEKFLEGANRT